MSAFGQSLSPAIFIDNVPRMLSATELIGYVARILVTVGMKPALSRWPRDITDPDTFQNPAVNPPTLNGTFLFDYPDESTFTIDGVAYRPCIQLRAFTVDVDSYPYDNGYLKSSTSSLQITPCIRLAGDYALDSVQELNQTIYTGTRIRWRDASYDSQVANRCDGSRIRMHQVARWAGSDWSEKRVNIRNIMAYLGPAGLFLCLGTGTARSEYANIMNCGFVFGGARLPNRAYPSGTDYDLNRINPIIPMFMMENDASVWNGTLHSVIHGMQFGLKPTFEAVLCRLYNLENLEWPVYPTYWPYTAPSPRKLSNGQGAHILSRLVQVPSHIWTDYENKFGPKVDDLTGEDVRPVWEDLFTAPGFRFCDRTAPLGDYEDPVSGTNWFLIPARNTGAIIGLMSENASFTDQTLNRTLFSWGVPIVVSFSGWVPALTETPANVNDRTIYYTTIQPVPMTIIQPDSVSYGGYDDMWAPDVVLNGIRSTGRNWDHPESGFPNALLEFQVQPQVGDPPDVMYFVTFSAANRHLSNNAARGYNPIHLEVFIDGAWVRKWSMLSAGTTLTDPQYELNPQGEFPLMRDITIPGEPLRFRFIHDGNHATIVGDIAEVADVQVVKKRYA